MSELETSAWPHRELSEFVDAGGLRWHVQRTGSGPSVLLVHGTGASTHTWRDVMPLLAPHHSVLAVDLPGHGFTDCAKGASSIPGMSGALAALLRRLKVDIRYAVGHSAGAVILCQMVLDARIAPRAIASINGAFLPLSGAAGVLFSPMARFIAGNPLLPRLVSWGAGNSASVARAIEGTGSQLGAEAVDLYARLVRNPKHVAGALAMMASWNLHAFMRALPGLQVPLALMVGENDRTVPPRQAAVVRQLVNRATIQRLAGLGHLAHEEEPKLVARELLAIFDAHP